MIVEAKNKQSPNIVNIVSTLQDSKNVSIRMVNMWRLFEIIS